MIAHALFVACAALGGQEPVVKAEPAPRHEDARPAPPSGAQATNAPAAQPEPAPARFTLDYAATWSEAQYEAELARLVQRHAANVRLSSIGASRDGRRVALLTVGALESGDPDTKPAVALVTGLEPGSDGHPRGPAAALHALRQILERADLEPAVRELLTRTTLYVVPAADPDALFGANASVPRACRLDRNFPSGWKPWSSSSCAQGPYPLSEPETRELARFLGSRTNAAAVVMLAPGDNARGESLPAPPANMPEATLCERMASALGAADALPIERSVQAAPLEPGSLAAFAHARLGAFVLPIDPWRSEVADTALGRAPSGFTTIAPGLERLLSELPRLVATTGKIERLREKLWLVEIALQDAALLPTACPEERRRSPASVWFTVTGARVAQAGLRRNGMPDLNLESATSGPWRLGHLEGGETVRMFLVVEGDAGATLQIAFQSTRGAAAHIAVPLVP